MGLKTVTATLVEISMDWSHMLTICYSIQRVRETGLDSRHGIRPQCPSGSRNQSFQNELCIAYVLLLHLCGDILLISPTRLRERDIRRWHDNFQNVFIRILVFASLQLSLSSQPPRGLVWRLTCSLINEDDGSFYFALSLLIFPCPLQTQIQTRITRISALVNPLPQYTLSGS